MTVLTFSSPGAYEVASIGDFRNVSMLDQIFVSGFPLPTSVVPLTFVRTLKGEVIAKPPKALPGGYQLLYSNPTLKGMSGGAVLNLNGHLIGIHGRAEQDDHVSESTGKAIATRTNMAVPISYYKRVDRPKSVAIIKPSTQTTGKVQPAASQSQSTPAAREFPITFSKDYKKLYYYQSSTRALDKASYYLILRPEDRKYSSILKLMITVPDYFGAKIKRKNLNLCLLQLGGMLSSTRCKEKVPAIFEISDDKSSIDIYPDTPIPAEGVYALVIKTVNPEQRGVFQFNALAQIVSDVPRGGYVGSWMLDIK